jgi:hypothetical protein
MLAGLSGSSGGDIPDGTDSGDTGGVTTGTGGTDEPNTNTNTNANSDQPVPEWTLSQPTWTRDGNVNYSYPSTTVPAHNVTFAFDNDVATVAKLSPPAPPGWINVDFGECLAIGGIRFRVPPGDPDAITSWKLEAAPGLLGPFYEIKASLCADPGDGSWMQFGFPPFSAQFWRVTALESNSGSSVAIADLQFATASTDVCDAELLQLDDLSIGVPKQRLLVKMVRGTSGDDRQVGVFH